MRAVFLFLFLIGFFGKRRIFRIAENFPNLLYAPAGAEPPRADSVGSWGDCTFLSRGRQMLRIFTLKKYQKNARRREGHVAKCFAFML